VSRSARLDGAERARRRARWVRSARVTQKAPSSRVPTAAVPTSDAAAADGSADVSDAQRKDSEPEDSVADLGAAPDISAQVPADGPKGTTQLH
jgi:hypothetical protein